MLPRKTQQTYVERSLFGRKVLCLITITPSIVTQEKKLSPAIELIEGLLANNFINFF